MIADTRYVDDRTEPQKETHPIIVAGTDSFMSFWGQAAGGLSYAGWACRHEDLVSVERWVRSRTDMKRVRVVGSDWKPKGSRIKHVHIYVVKEDHPALEGK